MQELIREGWKNNQPDQVGRNSDTCPLRKNKQHISDCDHAEIQRNRQENLEKNSYEQRQTKAAETKKKRPHYKAYDQAQAGIS